METKANKFLKDLNLFLNLFLFIFMLEVILMLIPWRI